LDTFIIVSYGELSSPLYLFGFMVLLSEILRSTLQEPVFFILFQPLHPHVRLKGHLIAKGHALQFALLGVGGYLWFYLQHHPGIPIIDMAKLLAVLLFFWLLMVFAVKKEYLQTLKTVLRKGYFTGVDLFL